MEWLMVLVVMGDCQRMLWLVIQWVNVVFVYMGQLGVMGGCGGVWIEQEVGGYCDEYCFLDYGVWMLMLGQR